MSDTAEAREEDEPKDTPESWMKLWGEELTAAKREVSKWQNSAGKIVKRFRDEREDRATKKLNLFSSNVITQRALMYGQVPKAQVTRSYADANDDVARVASEMMERLINCDIQRKSDTYATAIGLALSDFQLSGLGMVRLRYEMETEKVEVEAKMSEPDPSTGEVRQLAEGYTDERRRHEAAEVDYVHWRDVLWSPCRVWGDCRWVAFRVQMTRKAGIKRFGDVFKKAPLNTKSAKAMDDGESVPHPRGRADVWEIWSKGEGADEGKVFWLVEGMDRILDEKDDPLGLEGFFPCPAPLIANPTTDAVLPRPDFALHQDLYDDIDATYERICLLRDAVRVAGVYDETNEGLKSLLSDKASNQLYPVKNWNAFTEKGGLRNAVDWMPLEQIIGALTALRNDLREQMDMLFQVTGMSDLMRGQQTANGTPGEAQLKAKFGSVRMQAQQEEFARFASEALHIKAEIIREHFDPATIIARSNIMQTADAQFAEAAVQLIKSKEFAYRVEVKPEALSFNDFAALKQEKSEVLMGIGAFLQSTMPMVEAIPGSMPTLLEIMQWSLAGLRGASTIEGVLDRAIASAKQAQEQAAQNPQAEQPSPEQQKSQGRLMEIQAKGQLDMAKEEKRLQNTLIIKQADVASHAAQEATQREENVREHASKTAITQAMRNPFDGGMP